GLAGSCGFCAGGQRYSELSARLHLRSYCSRAVVAGAIRWVWPSAVVERNRTWLGARHRLEPAPRARVFLLPGPKRDSNARLLAATRGACVVRGQPIANFPLPPAQAHHACWSRLLLDPGDQTVACAAFAVSRLPRAARMP